MHRILEVERKFISRGASAFLHNKGPPPFRSIEFCGHEEFTDTYYDRANRLRLAGIYVRQRDSTWEAKIKKGGCFINSQFEETSSIPRIAKLVKEVAEVTNGLAPATTFGLDVFAKVRTSRMRWKADQEFSIVLDTTDFGHEVGEVEIQREFPAQTSPAVEQTMRQELDTRIQEFMAHYQWAFPEGQPKGKLSAYFEWKKERERKNPTPRPSINSGMIE